MKVLQLPAYFIPEQMASTHLHSNLHEALSEAKIYRELYVSSPTRSVSDEVRRSTPKDEILYNGYVKVHRFSMYREGRNPIMRALRYILCWCKQFYYGWRAKDIDLIYLGSTPPIQGALGALLKKIKKVPFIYILQDIFPDSLVGTGLAKKDGILWKVGRVIENFTYRNADKIIVISEDFKRNIMAKGVPEDKIVVVYNWVDEEAVKPINKESNPLYKELGINKDKFTVVYAGNLGNAQNVQILIDAAQELRDVEDIQFIIFGTGGLETVYKNEIEKNGLNNVTFYPLQPYEKVSQVYGIGDLCLVSCKEGLGGSAMPSKTWSIMSSGSAVLANFDEGDLKNIIEENKCGVFTKAGDKAAFTDAILKLYNNRELCEEYGRNGREFIMKNLTRAVGTQKYVDVIKSFER